MYSNPSRSGIIGWWSGALLWSGWAAWAPSYQAVWVAIAMVCMVLGTLELGDWLMAGIKRSNEQTQHTHSCP